MEPLLVHPDPPDRDLTKILDGAFWLWSAAASAAEASALEPADGWSGAIISAELDAKKAFSLCNELRKRDIPLEPVLLICAPEQLPELELREDLFDDFCLAPVVPAELESRLKHLFWKTGGGTRPELIEHGALVLNVETYQATLGGKPLDLTYMEYELLKFMVSHPAKVFTRETLLSRVWGYEYYGGARTVDVHIRRLRSKFGDQHCALIQTVRSVGYSFGNSRSWHNRYP